MVRFSGPPAAAIRNKPVSDELSAVLRAAAEDAGVDHIRITSGGQPGTHGRRIGSTRHDAGRAADLQLIVGGVVKTFTDSSASAAVRAFVTAAAKYGATGIGAGVGYMGRQTIHIGFGLTPADARKLTWGAGGASAAAPQWLRDAAQAGWDAPQDPPERAAPTGDLPARFRVIARAGLKLRGGPGLDYGVQAVLPEGAEVTVSAFGGADGAWASVDLEDDGLIDGHMHGDYLALVSGAAAGPGELAEEPA